MSERNIPHLRLKREDRIIVTHEMGDRRSSSRQKVKDVRSAEVGVEIHCNAEVSSRGLPSSTTYGLRGYMEGEFAIVPAEVYGVNKGWNEHNLKFQIDDGNDEVKWSYE